MATTLDIEGVSLAFGTLQALDDVSLVVETGTTVGLIGPNGAGKTTLFNVIAGLQRADAGRVIFEGDDITTEPAPERARRGMGRSFQNLGLIAEETVLTNLLAAQFLHSAYTSGDVLLRPWRWRRGEQNMRERAVEAAQLFGLGPDLDTRVADLSFGHARFVELACVLVQDRRIVMLDEPTTGLDVREVRRLVDVVQVRRAAGDSLLVVAHDVRFVMEVCDRVYVLVQGRILAEGPPSEIQRHPAVVEAYLGRTA